MALGLDLVGVAIAQGVIAAFGNHDHVAVRFGGGFEHVVRDIVCHRDFHVQLDVCVSSHLHEGALDVQCVLRQMILRIVGFDLRIRVGRVKGARLTALRLVEELRRDLHRLQRRLPVAERQGEPECALECSGPIFPVGAQDVGARRHVGPCRHEGAVRDVDVLLLSIGEGVNGCTGVDVELLGVEPDLFAQHRDEVLFAIARRRSQEEARVEHACERRCEAEGAQAIVRHVEVTDDLHRENVSFQGRGGLGGELWGRKNDGVI